MVFEIVFLVLLGSTSALADYEQIYTSYNDDCPDLAAALGKGCDVTSSDCTEIKCRDQSLGDKDLTLTIKLKKCEDPPSVDITVDALGFSWTHSFQSDQRIAVPGLSVKFPGQLASAGVYLKVQLKDTGSNLKLKIILLSGFEIVGEFQTLTTLTLAESDLPISTWECGIVRWWNSLSTFLKVLVVCGGLVVVGTLGTCCCCCCCCCRCCRAKSNSGPVVVGTLGTCCCCCCCCCRCCRAKSNSGPVVVVPPAPAAMTSTKTNVPMQPFVNEI